ncbi:MAG: NAD(P)-dependent alcohol dehydrogenase [Pseudomonadota bacterium]
MKAITYYRYGPPDVLGIEEIEAPQPNPDEVLIRVQAAEVTKSDCEMRSFRYAVKWFWLPLRLYLGLRAPRRPVLGGYFAGEIVAVGRDVNEFAPGDPILGSAGLRLGAHAEYMTLPASYTLVAKPPSMDFETAAAMSLGGLNALHFLRSMKVKAGDRVLINGAGGSIGAWAIQIAKAMGAEVTAVDKPAKEQALRGFGADHFIDYTRTSFVANGETYDAIFDMVPNSSYSGCMQRLAPGGHYCTGNPTLFRMLRCGLTNLFTSRTATFSFAGETREELQTLVTLFETGQIRSIVDTVYPMDKVVEAHQRVENEERSGAIVISFNRSG